MSLLLNSLIFQFLLRDENIIDRETRRAWTATAITQRKSKFMFYSLKYCFPLFVYKKLLLYYHISALCHAIMPQ